MPRSASPRISRSCAAGRIRRTMCSRRANCGFPPSASPITTRWPAWCGPTRNSKTPKLAYKPKLLIGARLVFIDGTPDILVYPRDRAAYGRLCQLLTRGKRGDDADKTEKGECRLGLDDLLEFAEGQLLVLTLPHRFEPAKALEILGPVAAQPRRWRVAGGKPALSRRRPAPPGAAAASRQPPACRCWRPTRCCITIPRAVRCRMCSPAFARRPRSTPSASGWKPMRNAISSRRTKWRGCFAIMPEAIAETMRFAGRITFLARSAQIPISRRAGAAGQDRAAASGRPDLGGVTIFLRRDPRKAARHLAQGARADRAS